MEGNLYDLNPLFFYNFMEIFFPNFLKHLEDSAVLTTKQVQTYIYI